jgi:large subunit ribosomal protein L13
MVKIVYDGTDAVFGRLASQVAKDLLKGDEVDIINCEKMIFSGDKKLLAEKILTKRNMGSGASMKGPKFPRTAEKLVKRMIRGMLPRDRMKGQDAYRRLKCYVGGENDKAIKVKHQMPRKFATAEEVVRLLK